jgi:hypothetical protein
LVVPQEKMKVLVQIPVGPCMKEWMCLSGDKSQHSRDRDGCKARSRSSTSPTDERYNAETLLNADHLRKNTNRSLLKPQIGAYDAEKTPDDSDDSE